MPKINNLLCLLIASIFLVMTEWGKQLMIALYQKIIIFNAGVQLVDTSPLIACCILGAQSFLSYIIASSFLESNMILIDAPEDISLPVSNQTEKTKVPDKKTSQVNRIAGMTNQDILVLRKSFLSPRISRSYSKDLKSLGSSIEDSKGPSSPPACSIKERFPFMSRSNNIAASDENYQDRIAYKDDLQMESISVEKSGFDDFGGKFKKPNIIPKVSLKTLAESRFMTKKTPGKEVGKSTGTVFSKNMLFDSHLTDVLSKPEEFFEVKSDQSEPQSLNFASHSEASIKPCSKTEVLISSPNESKLNSVNRWEPEPGGPQMAKKFSASRESSAGVALSGPQNMNLDRKQSDLSRSSPPNFEGEAFFDKPIDSIPAPGIEKEKESLTMKIAQKNVAMPDYLRADPTTKKTVLQKATKKLVAINRVRKVASKPQDNLNPKKESSVLKSKELEVPSVNEAVSDAHNHTSNEENIAKVKAAPSQAYFVELKAPVISLEAEKLSIPDATSPSDPLGNKLELQKETKKLVAVNNIREIVGKVYDKSKPPGLKNATKQTSSLTGTVAVPDTLLLINAVDALNSRRLPNQQIEENVANVLNLIPLINSADGFQKTPIDSASYEAITSISEKGEDSVSNELIYKADEIVFTSKMNRKRFSHILLDDIKKDKTMVSH